MTMEDTSADGWVEVAVSVEGADRERIDEVAERLRDRGMHISRILEFTGTVTGSIPIKVIDDFRQVPGVSAIEQLRQIQLPPPDAEVQ